jgi:diguanylate cyclase (GGDEF)-like protein/PAS domain S-box-containing protein
MSWCKRALLVVLFLTAFLILDGSSTASIHWEGAPPWYLPVGLSMALLLCSGMRAVPLVLICSIIAAAVNYHRPLFSWCGIPGAVGVYGGYIAAALLLKRWWCADLTRGTLSDVGRYIVGCLGGSVVSTVVGIWTLLADGRIRRFELLLTAAEWWTSDMLAIVAFAPFLVICVAPFIHNWLSHDGIIPPSLRWFGDLSPAKVLEHAAQLGCVLFSIWFIFGYAPSIRYQPLYLLFIPVIWVAVRRGLSGTTVMIFTIGVGMMLAAWVTQAPRDSLPRLQLATLALGLTGLCLGAVVTDRQRGEQSIRESERRYRLLFERNLAGVFRTTMCGRILECNPAAAQLFGYDSPEELLGGSVTELYQTAMEREAFLTKMKAEKYISNHEMRLRRKDGNPVWAVLNATLVETDTGGGGILEGTLVDISERKRAEERVQSLAYYDSLTSLPNRALLRDRLTQALAGAARRGSKVALLFVDLDGFKTINDSLGHSTGDLLLQEVAHRLKACTREQDTVARLGGDEFLIVLTDVKDVPDVAISAERFMDAMTERFVLQGQSLSVACSVGISIFPDHGLDTETLIKHADSAMYSAKDNGRNNFMFFTADMNKQAMERLRLENALRMALHHGELFLVYQPQMEIATGQIVGLEALLRWKHPELGLVPPDRFIRIAETSGLILPIGEWVLKTACLQATKWQDAGLTAVPVAVNVSAVQFRHEEFCERVRTILRETGLAPNYLELELTESLLLANADVTLSVLEKLKSMGVALAIDDFGTGYSSLSYLRRFPVGKLKIDRSFIKDLGVNQGDAAITTAIISMAKSLNLKVIAEGVETEEQMSFLRERECGGIQGFYFSKPLSVDEVPSRLAPVLASSAMRLSKQTALSAAIGKTK